MILINLSHTLEIIDIKFIIIQFVQRVLLVKTKTTKLIIFVCQSLENTKSEVVLVGSIVR